VSGITQIALCPAHLTHVELIVMLTSHPTSTQKGSTSDLFQIDDATGIRVRGVLPAR